MLRRLLPLAAAAVLLASPVLAGPPRGLRPLQESDLRKLVTLLEPQIAPDGKYVALVVRRPDFVKNTYRNELVLVDVRSGAARPLVRERDDVNGARWSRNGDRIAYLATPPKDPDDKDEPQQQLYVLRLDGGEPTVVTAAKKGVESFAWRPDGRGFAYLARDESPDAKRIAAHDDWFEVTDNAWTSRGNRAPAHLWTIDANGKRAHRVTRGTWSLDGDPAYAPDGRSVFVIRTPSASTNHYRARSLVAVDLASGRVREIAPRIRSADSPRVTPDGKRLVYSGEHPTAFSQSELYAADLDGRGTVDLTARLDRDVQFAEFLPHERLVVGANDATHDRLFLLGGAPHALPLGEVDLAGAATASRDGSLVFIGTTPVHPAELYVLRDGARAPQRLTHYNDAVAAHLMGRTRTIVWRSADGYHPNGVLTEPVGAVHGKKYPLVVLIHGGPTATSTEGFSALAQLMSARGWYVFQPNYRGSDNLGHRFAQATVPHITSAPAKDVLDGVDAVVKLGVVDSSRIGVSGWSEGGLLTSWLIARDHRWRAAMSGAAVNDWTGYADLTDAQDFAPSFIGPSPWSNEQARALYDAESPLTYAADVRTPTLIMTDAGDQRVPTPLAYEFYHAVRATGTPVEMVVFPVNGHNPSDPLHREDRTHRWVDWFARHL